MTASQSRFLVFAARPARLSRHLLLAGVGAALVCLSAWTSLASADPISGWIATDHARMRLIDAGQDGGRRLAGVQIQLDPSYITYWRTPGEAGVPPRISFEGSRNLASATLAFPAPQRFDEGGSEAFGYAREVVFPVVVTPSDPALPVQLAVSLDFAVCSAMCLPATAAARLTLEGHGDGPEATLVREARGRVPVPLPIGGAGPLAIETIDMDASRTAARVVVRAPSGTPPQMFAEAPDPWYFQAGVAQSTASGRYAFELRALAGPKQPDVVQVTLTVSADRGAVETTAQLDVSAPTP